MNIIQITTHTCIQGQHDPGTQKIGVVQSSYNYFLHFFSIFYMSLYDEDDYISQQRPFLYNLKITITS